MVLLAAVADDSDITITVNDAKITNADFTKLNAIPATHNYPGGFTGRIVATIGGQIFRSKGAEIII